MAKIVDPDNLAVAVNTTATTEEVEIQTGTKTIKLTLVGGLDDTSPGKTSGVTAKALYSFLKEEWLNGADAATLRRFKFPLKMIFEGSFIWTNGWAPADQQTRDLIRDAGFQEGVSGNEYACMVSLGSIDNPSVDQAYYTQVAGFTQTPTNYDKTGEINENVDITTNDTYLKSFLREQGKLYAQYSLLAEQGLATLNFQAYSFPLSNGEDLKITTAVGSTTFNDTDIASGGSGTPDTAPYNGMSIAYYAGNGFTDWAAATLYPAEAVVRNGGRWYFTDAGGTDSATFGDTITWVAYEGEELIGSTYYAFNRAVECNGGTDRQAYAFMQYMLRQSIDINTGTITDTNQDTFGTVNGNVAAPLAEYVGDTLKPFGGVVLRNFDTNSTNNIVHRPIPTTGGLDSEGVPAGTLVDVAFPFVAAGNFNFSNNLVTATDAETFYTTYFQYITTTTSTGLAITGATGSTATFDYTADAGALDFLSATAGGADDASADYISVSGFTNPENNGFWVLTGNPTTNTFTATKADGATVVNETAGASVTVLENPFESPEAIIVKDNSNTDISGQVTAGTIGWDFDYTNNTQGGRTADSDAAIIVVAQSLQTAEWISANHTITKATGQSIAVNAGDERNYANPA